MNTWALALRPRVTTGLPFLEANTLWLYIGTTLSTGRLKVVDYVSDYNYINLQCELMCDKKCVCLGDNDKMSIPHNPYKRYRFPPKSFNPDPRAAENTIAVLMPLGYIPCKASIFLLTATRFAVSPIVVTAGRDLQQATHHNNWKCIAAAFNHVILHLGCLAKYAAASLKKSRSFFT